jgi:hypothetical protein
LVARNDVRSEVALVKHEAPRLTPDIADVTVELEHSRMAKYSHQKASGQLSPDPTATGVMPLALSLALSDSSWGIVVGVDVMPACANRSLRYQKPTT